MTTAAELLAQAERLVREARARLDAPGRQAPDLTALLESLGRVKREVDAATAVVASEVARQSRRELGRDSLSRKQGFRSPTAMIAAVTGTSAGDAVRLVHVGDAIVPGMNLAGETIPARHPHVAAAVEAGRLGTSGAAAIVELLDRVAVRAGRDRCLRMEEILAARLPGATPDESRRLLIEAEAVLDQDGAEPRHDAARAAREVRTSQDADGMTVIRARLDAETAAPVLAVLEAEVTRVVRTNEHTADDALKDTRTVPQIQADALAALAAHALGCDQAPTRATTTVVVRMDAQALLAATGHSGGDVVARGERGEKLIRIDGIEQPVPASVIRRMAADADIIPVLLGREGQVLDLGRRERLFTRAQKLALVERDGGCAFCGAPPGHTVVHHVRWWSRGGPTDLGNGVLLCTACHHRVHDDGWEIEVEGQRPVHPAALAGSRSQTPSGRTRSLPARGIASRATGSMDRGPPSHSRPRIHLWGSAIGSGEALSGAPHLRSARPAIAWKRD